MWKLLAQFLEGFDFKIRFQNAALEFERVKAVFCNKHAGLIN